VGRGNFHLFVMFNIIVILQGFVGLAVIVRNKLFYEEYYNLKYFDLNAVKTFVLFNTKPIRMLLSEYLVPRYLTRT